MSKNPVDVIQELKRSALSSDKVQELYGQFYSIMPSLYAQAQGDKEKTATVKALDHNLSLFWQEFQASQTRIKVMGAAIQEKSKMLTEATDEALRLANLLNEQSAAESIVPVYTNGHKKGGRR